MPDHKYEQGNDRQRTTLDFKQRVIDMMANKQPLPEVGIYDEPVRYFKANEQWCAVIFGWLDWLEDIAGWQDATDENYAGIQQILIFEEGIEPMSIDYEAWYDANKRAIYDAVNDIAKQIISGRTTDIAVGGDGTVTDPSEDPSTDLPEDNPETPFDEAEAARSGGASAVRIGINTIWSSLNTWYLAGVTEAGSQYRLKDIYILDEAASDELVTAYYAARVGALPYVSSFANTLDSYLYCKSITKQTIAEWIYEVHTANQQSMASFLLPALTEQQISSWFEQGAKVPSGDYISYSCVPIDPEEWILDSAYLAAVVYKTGAQITKVNHRTLVEVSGKVFHPSDGSYQDFYYHVAADGTKTFVGTASAFGTVQFNNPLKPTQSKLPWREDGIYASTIETVEADIYEFRRAISLANQAPGTTGFTIKITDLGEVIS